jgi:selenide,water dikinase
MGARPLFGLNIVGWNSAELSDELLVEALEGAAQTAAEGGWLIVGGHSVDDPEPKLGVAVIGEGHPDRLLTKAGMHEGDALVLTKPLGVGVITTALKRGIAPDATVAAATASMVRTNAAGAEVALAHGATAMTDVTGFGLLGHLRGMLDVSGVDAVIAVPAVPVLDGVSELVAAGAVPGGTQRNLTWSREQLDHGRVDEATLAVLADPQTSGGLLFSVAVEAADAAVAALVAQGHQAAIIGRVTAGDGTTHLRR